MLIKLHGTETRQGAVLILFVCLFLSVWCLEQGGESNEDQWKRG